MPHRISNDKSNQIREAADTHDHYPITTCLKSGHLAVSHLHAIYYATYGNPRGIPVVTLHGGPGAGFQESVLKVFDPERYYVVVFDQRGAMRSTPFGSLKENTTSHLIEDIEELRKHLKIDQWLVFGGSWGAALATLYGEAYPDQCLRFILRGVNLLRKQDAHHIVYGMGKIFPEAYADVVEKIPQVERGDLIAAYYHRVIAEDPKIFHPAARAFLKYDMICSSLIPEPSKLEKALQNDQLVVGLARFFFHYAIHDFFIRENQILEEINKIQHLPAIIIQGRWDIICPSEMAYLLHKSWENSELWFVSQAGHSNDPAIDAALATATDRFADKLA